MVAPKRPYGRRLLFPAEVELCKVLGISEDEYWYFQDTIATYNGQRPKGYELIPDIQAGELLAIKAVQTFLINLGIAVAASYITYLLTPKPKGPGDSRRTADVIGNRRFAPQTSFNSIQELANIGDSIPLVFANQYVDNNGIAYGGVRVNSQLLWSQFVSLGRFQQLKALALFSYGKISDEWQDENDIDPTTGLPRVYKHPMYEGFAIGDSLIDTYNAYKVGLYFRDGSVSGLNRIIESDKYDEAKLPYEGEGNEPFVVGVPDSLAENDTNRSGTKVSKAFSGARNPSTQTVFGAYSPVPNAQICRLPYEYVRSSRGQEQDPTQDLARKRKKVEFARWPTRAGLLSIYSLQSDGSFQQVKTKGSYAVKEGDKFDYQIVGTDTGSGEQIVYGSTTSGDAFNYHPHGVEDVNSMTISIRENTDNVLAVGEQYLFGTALAICEESSAYNDRDQAPWVLETTKGYRFKVIEAGYIDLPVDGAQLATHGANPVWYDPTVGGFHAGRTSRRDALYSLNDTSPVFWQQYVSGTVLEFPRGERDLYYGHNIYTGMKVALATVSNNRACDVTEIGLKSKVFKRISFANVQSQPSFAVFEAAYWDRTQITLGQVNTYANRLSFFMLQARKLGDSTWLDLINTGENNHSGLFAIRGNSPEDQYNAITISHPTTGQYEFRFKPYPGNYLIRGNALGQKFNLLSSSGNSNAEADYFQSHGFEVAFIGNEQYLIDKEEASNPHWQLGNSTVTTTRKVTAATNNGQNKWESNPGAIVTRGVAAWRDFAVHTAGSKYLIVLWNSLNEPHTGWAENRRAAGLKDYTWALYDGVRTDWSDDSFPNGNGNWAQVYFDDQYTGSRFVVADPNTYFHPDNNPRHFWVIEQKWISEPQNISPTLHSTGVVDAVYPAGVTGSGLKFNVEVWKVETNVSGEYYYTVNWTINALGVNHTNGSQVEIPWTDAGGTQRKVLVTLAVQESTITAIDTYGFNQNFNPFDVISDWNVYQGDENSNKDNPEHEIVYVNEIVKPRSEENTTGLSPAEYNNLAFAGIRINSSKEWANFTQFSAYFKKGIEIEKINQNGTSGGQGASNLFPEIAYALLTDVELGAGKLVGVDSVDKEAMGNAADFCNKNQFFWDGVISSKTNLRNLIFEQAAYCLLDFTIIGGKFSFKPSVPVSNNVIDRTVLPEIKCLFTDGNINELQVSFLSAEERQPIRANVLFRKEKPNGFPETESLLIEEVSSDTENPPSSTDPIETFDLSGFCTSRRQATYFGYFAIKSRRLIDHGLTFKTAPQYVKNLSPGDYFRLVSEVTHTSRFNNGAKLEDGTIVSKDDMTGSESVYYWEPGTVGVRSSTLSQVPNGSLFTVKNATTENKVYKCESISYSEDGLLEIAGSHAPVETNGQLSIMQGWGMNDLTDFEINKNR